MDNNVGITIKMCAYSTMIMFGGIASVLIYLLAVLLSDKRRSSAYTTVYATILDVNITTMPPLTTTMPPLTTTMPPEFYTYTSIMPAPKNQTYTYLLSYSYDGKDYTQRIEVFNPKKNGDKIKIYINKENPTEFDMNEPLPAFIIVIMVIGVIVCSFVVYVAYYYPVNTCDFFLIMNLLKDNNSNSRTYRAHGYRTSIL